MEKDSMVYKLSWAEVPISLGRIGQVRLLWPVWWHTLHCGPVSWASWYSKALLSRLVVFKAPCGRPRERIGIGLLTVEVGSVNICESWLFKTACRWGGKVAYRVWMFLRIALISIPWSGSISISGTMRLSCQWISKCWTWSLLPDPTSSFIKCAQGKPFDPDSTCVQAESAFKDSAFQYCWYTSSNA